MFSCVMPQVIGRDMAPFLILLGIIIVGSMFFFVICNPSSSAFGYNEASLGALWPLFTVFLASMGNPIDVLGTDDFGTWPAILMLCGFLFFVVIILCASLSSSDLSHMCCAECLVPRRMNVLIAIMADSYEMVKEHEKVEALHERAKMIADMELLHPGWHRFSTYMHVCEAADEDSGLEPEWAGVAGRVKVLLGEVKSDLWDGIADAKSELQLEVAKAATADNLTSLASDVSTLQAGMHEQQHNVAALASDVAAMKAVLEQLVAGLPLG